MFAPEPIWIYGFYREDGVAVYVGQTVWPKIREGTHRNWKRGHTKKLVVGCKFRLIRQTTFLNASRIEYQIILAYKRRGQCCGNTSKRCSVPKCIGNTVASSDGMKFPSISAAERYYKVGRGTVSYGLKHNEGWIFFDWEDDFENGKHVQLRLL